MDEEESIAGPERLIGSSFDSFEDAVGKATQSKPRKSNVRVLEVVRLSVEEGGVVGRTQYRVELIERGRGRP